MSSDVRFSDLVREADGRVTALKHVEGHEPERVNVRVSVEREHRRADGSLVSLGEVASSDRPAGEHGRVEVGS